MPLPISLPPSPTNGDNAAFSGQVGQVKGMARFVRIMALPMMLWCTPLALGPVFSIKTTALGWYVSRSVVAKLRPWSAPGGGFRHCRVRSALEAFLVKHRGPAASTLATTGSRCGASHTYTTRAPMPNPARGRVMPPRGPSVSPLWRPKRLPEPVTISTTSRWLTRSRSWRAAR